MIEINLPERYIRFYDCTGMNDAEAFELMRGSSQMQTVRLKDVIYENSLAYATRTAKRFMRGMLFV